MSGSLQATEGPRRRARRQVAEADQLALAERDALPFDELHAEALQRRAQRLLQRRTGSLFVVIAEHGIGAVAQGRKRREGRAQVAFRLVCPVAGHEHRIDVERIQGGQRRRRGAAG